MRYDVEHISGGSSETFQVCNTLTNEGSQYIFRRCFDKNYTTIDSFQYSLINGLGFEAIDITDTLATRKWMSYFLFEVYPYTPTLELFDEGGVIRGNPVDIYIPNDGVVMGLAITGRIILSVAAFDDPRPVKRGDFLSLTYNIELP